MVEAAGLTPVDREAISARATDLVRTVRAGGSASIMQGFLAEYGLSSREGVALMCLAEALLRVPDTETIDALIEDKIAASQLGCAPGAIELAAGQRLHLGAAAHRQGAGRGGGRPRRGAARRGQAARRAGHPRGRSPQAMRELGHQFVLGRDMDEAMNRAAELEAQGYGFSYDMLGEAVRTEADARRYHLAYSDSITALADVGRGASIRERPGDIGQALGAPPAL